jgi:PAS domain S-box-containing protein
MVGAAEREKIIQQIQNAGGHGRDIEIKIRKSGGEMIDIFYSVERIEIDDEACFATALVDITERKKTEAEIIAAQKRFTTIFNVSPVAIALTTVEEGRFKFVNDAFCDMTGYNREEIIGKKSIEVNILNAEDREKTLYQILRAGGRGKDIESRIRKTTGEIIDVLFSVERIEIDNEMCFAYAWVDISARKKAEGQIRILNDTLEKRVQEKTREIVEKEKQYRFLLENMREGIQVIGVDWRYLFVNRSVLQQVKHSSEELLGHSMMEKYPGIENTELFQVLERCMRERTSQIFENEFTFPDGTKSCFELSIQPVPEGLFILSMDITERKKAEQAIVASEETRRLIMNAAQDAIVCIDSSSLVTVWTPQAEKTFGWTEQEVIGKNISDIIIPPQYRESHTNGMANYLHTGEGPVLNKLIEITAINKAGTTFPVELSIVPFYQNSKTFFCGFIRDITQRKKAQEEIQQLTDSLEQKVIERTAQLEASNKELDSFSYSVSHDLRAPLRAIDGYARILQEEYGDKLDREGRRLTKVITNNAQKMGQLIDDLLAFSRLGKQHIVKVDIDMNTLVHSIVDKLISEENKKSIEFDIKPLLNAGGDSSMVRQVMINLISNAVKYSGKKEKPVIEIGSYKENGSINYYVKDNGAGFDARYTDKLFNVFQRLHGANEFEGTGVGLAIVHRIITRHGGKVWAEGKVNEGAVFYFSLPDSGLLNN